MIYWHGDIGVFLKSLECYREVSETILEIEEGVNDTPIEGLKHTRDFLKDHTNLLYSMLITGHYVKE